MQDLSASGFRAYLDPRRVGSQTLAPKAETLPQRAQDPFKSFRVGFWMWSLVMESQNNINIEFRPSTYKRRCSSATAAASSAKPRIFVKAAHMTSAHARSAILGLELTLRLLDPRSGIPNPGPQSRNPPPESPGPL